MVTNWYPMPIWYHYGIEMYAAITLPLMHFANKQQHAVASLMCDPNHIALRDSNSPIAKANVKWMVYSICENNKDRW